MTKRLLRFASLILIGLVDILVYRGIHLFYKAKDRTPSLDRKIVLLERARRPLPWNDLILHESGKAYFESGVSRLQNAAIRDADFGRSRARFLRSLALNPFSPTAHFDFAQTLEYLNALDLPSAEHFFEEYKNAARLSGTDQRVFADVGKIMMVRWPALAEEDRRFAVEIGRAALTNGAAESLESFLQAWDLAVRDREVLESILPLRSEAYRQAARFIAEKSLERSTRLDLMVKAEAMDFAAARERLSSGERDFQVRRIPQAAGRFREAKALLDRIYFFQNPAGTTAIDPLDYKSVLKSVHLGSAKCRLEETRGLEEAAADLGAYLSLEDQPGAVADLVTFLKERGLIEADKGTSVRDFARSALELELGLKQSRYRDVVKAGLAFEKNVVIVPEEAKKGFARIIEIAGDAYQKLDSLYESNDVYARALAMGADEIAVRLKMKKNYERLNDLRGLKEVDDALVRLMSPSQIALPAAGLLTGSPWSFELTLPPSRYILILEFADLTVDRLPYLTVAANKQVIWDDYLSGPSIRIALPAVPGKNILEIASLNGSVKITGAVYVPESGNIPGLKR
jgi:hypothetical protein